MSDLDSKIKDLLKKTEAEQKALEELKEKSNEPWKTRGAFVTPNETVLKIKVLQKDKLVTLTEMVLAQSKSKTEVVNILNMSDEDKETFSLIQGHAVEDWIADIKKRWAFLELRSHEKALNEKMEKIRSILSDEQIREMEYEKLLNI